jgi:hypothetical protein
MIVIAASGVSTFVLLLGLRPVSMITDWHLRSF